MKPTKALALIDNRNKIIPEWVITPKYEKEYVIKKGEKFEKVVILKEKDYLKLKGNGKNGERRM